MKTKSLSKNIILAFLIFLGVSLAFSLMSVSTDKVEEMTLSQLASAVNEEKISEVVILGNDLNIVLKEENKKAHALKENEASLSETLKNYGVDSEKLRKVSIAVKEPSGALFWIETIVPFLLPFLLLGLLVWFMFRQAQRGSMQAFSFIKTKAKMASPAEKVTFNDVAGLKEAKEELKEVVDFLRNPKKFLDIGAKIPRGVLLIGPPGTGKCLVGSTLVLTQKGLIPIEDIPKYFVVGVDGSVSGATLVTMDLKTKKNISVPASHWYDLGEQDTVRVISDTGTTIEGTSEHPLIVLDEKGDFVFRKLGELKVGERMVVKYNTQTFGTANRVSDTDTAYLLGLLTGDGGLTTKGRLCFTNSDREIVEFFTGYFQTRFQYLPLRGTKPYDWVVQDQHIYDLFTHRYGLAALYAKQKIVPEWILLSPKPVMRAFVQGLFDTDGTTDRRHGYVQLSSSSPHLTRTLHVLLLNFGVVNRLHGRRVLTTGRMQYYLEVSGDALGTFQEEIGFRLARKREALAAYLQETSRNTNRNLMYNQHAHFRVLRDFLKTKGVDLTNTFGENGLKNLLRWINRSRQPSLATCRLFLLKAREILPSIAVTPSFQHLASIVFSGFYFSRVVKIESARARVYDFTVPKHHSFIAGGVINHNTLLARAVAGEASVPFYHISGSEFVEMFVGVGASIKGDELVLVKENSVVRLRPIKEVVDKHYQENQNGVVSVSGLETLGVAKKETNFRGFKNNQDKFLFGGSRWTSVKGVYRHKVKEVYEIHYRGGKIETTGDHSVFIREKNYVKAKRADELKSGDTLVNLPFKTRGIFIPGLGTTHNVKGHQFENYQPIKLTVWEENTELLEKYRLVMNSRDLVFQRELAQKVGVSQTTVGEWQRRDAYPRELSFKVFRSRINIPQEVAVTPNLMRLLGYYTAEGRRTEYFTQFVFGAHEPELHQDCVSLMKDIFHLDAHLEYTDDNTLRITYHSKEIGEFFDRYCGNGSRKKRVPAFIWELPYPYVWEYVKGYSLGDGYHTTDGKLSITSVSEQLIRELNWLLAMHGIQAGVREMRAPAGRVIKNKPLPETISWNLIIGKTSNVWSDKPVKSPNQFKKPIVTKVIKKEYDGYVYDFCGCENEAFFAGQKPLLVHNSRVRDTFQMAKKSAPAILFIDELDAIGRHRGAGLGGGHDEREQTLNQILVEMDGFERETQVIVMSATNRPDILDPALLRPGRFDRRVILDEPDINDREQILKIHSKGKPLDKTVDLRRVAERTPGFSGADLANMMNEGAILAARRNKKIISQVELIEAIEKVMLGPERKSHILSPKEKEVTAYHEAGHALVAAVLPGTDPVHKVSIISRGRAGGYTLKLPSEDRHLYTKTQFISDLAVMIGGYSAEQIVFNEITTGASNDLQRATELARRLVTQFGMSDKLGPMTFGHQEELIFLGKEIHESRNYSENIAFEIDKEVKKLITDAYRTAQKMIRHHRSKLNEIAQRLIEKETIEKEEFEKLMQN